MKKKYHFSLLMIGLWILAALSLTVSITYAWFTFRAETNVEPITSTVSGGDVALLIATDPQGNFSTKCVLPQKEQFDFEPVSTYDLEHFYEGYQQGRNGITTLYQECTPRYQDMGLYGELYLKSLQDDCSIYFYRPNMDFGTDAQALASARLGIRIHNGEEVVTYIFALNQMGNTTGAEKRSTIASSGNVVKNILQNGQAEYSTDPAIEMGDYVATNGSNSNSQVIAGKQPLTIMNADEVVRMEYWLYLEGCDEQCINAVQNRDLVLQLSFAGVIHEEEHYE